MFYLIIIIKLDFVHRLKRGMSSSRGRKEKEQKNMSQQLTDFANDSANFFNKCAKPDRKGKLK